MTAILCQGVRILEGVRLLGSQEYSFLQKIFLLPKEKGLLLPLRHKVHTYTVIKGKGLLPSRLNLEAQSCLTIFLYAFAAQVLNNKSFFLLNIDLYTPHQQF